MCLFSEAEQKFIIAGLLFSILFNIRKDQRLYFGSPHNIHVTCVTIPGKLILFPVRDTLTSFTSVSSTRSFDWNLELDKLSIYLVRESLYVTVSLGIWKTVSGNHVSTLMLMHVENSETDHLQHDLYVNISYKFTLAWVFVSHACTLITMNTFVNDLVLFTGIIQS